MEAIILTAVLSSTAATISPSATGYQDRALSMRRRQMLRLALAALLLAITTVPAKSAEIVIGSSSAVSPTTAVLSRHHTDHIKFDSIKAKGDRRKNGESVNTCLLNIAGEIRRYRALSGNRTWMGRTVRNKGRCWVDVQDLAKRLTEARVAATTA